MTSFEHGDAQLSLGSELRAHFRGGGPGGSDGWWLATEVDVVYSETQVLRHGVSGWRNQPEGYLIAATVTPGERARLEPFDAVELDVARLFGDLE